MDYKGEQVQITSSCKKQDLTEMLLSDHVKTQFMAMFDTLTLEKKMLLSLSFTRDGLYCLESGRCSLLASPIVKKN
jgi:hypothetical protein